LAAIRERWAILHESSRQIVGGIDGLCTRDSLPELDEYDKVPLPTLPS